MRDTIESADIMYGVSNGLSLCLQLIFLAPWKRDVTALELYLPIMKRNDEVSSLLRRSIRREI